MTGRSGRTVTRCPETLAILFLGLLPSGAMIAPALAAAEDEESRSEASASESPDASSPEKPADSMRVRFFVDTSTDRTPATTAFPQYPRVARRDRIEGEATVCFKIDLYGRIHNARVQNYSHRIFRRPVLQAIKASSFEPLKPNEILSQARSCRTYRFRLMPVTAANDH